MAVIKGFASLETIELCWGPSKVDIPKAPGLGLLLDKVSYRICSQIVVGTLLAMAVMENSLAYVYAINNRIGLYEIVWQTYHF